MFIWFPKPGNLNNKYAIKQKINEEWGVSQKLTVTFHNHTFDGILYSYETLNMLGLVNKVMTNNILT